MNTNLNPTPYPTGQPTGQRTIVQVPTANLVGYEKNPRRIMPEAFERLKTSLIQDKDYLWSRPLLVNRVNGILTVYGGNQRLAAAIALGYTEIPCIIEDNLPDKMVRDRMLKDNSTYGEWDWEMLSEQFMPDEILSAGIDTIDLAFYDKTQFTADFKENKPRSEKDRNPTITLIYENDTHLLEHQQTLRDLAKAQGCKISIKTRNTL